MLKKYGLVLLFAVLWVSAAPAGTKEEIIQLQSDVVQLQTKIVDLQKSMSANAKTTHDLLIQIKDDVGATATAITDFRKRLQSQQTEIDATFNEVMKQLKLISEKVDSNDQRLSVLAEQVKRLMLKSEEPKPVAGSEKVAPANELYDTAYKDFLAGNFELSLQGFQQFVRFYGSTDRAAEAQFYIGESYNGLKRYAEAIKAFDDVLTTYPTASVNPAALLKSGLIAMDMGNRSEAIGRLQAVVEKYRSSSEASIAKKKLELLGASIKPASGRTRPTNKRRGQ